MTRAHSIAFVVPRFSEAGTVGGAETLLKSLAERAAAAGCRVTILTTCAKSHFTWENEIAPGSRRCGALDVHYFPVDARDVAAYRRMERAMRRNDPMSPADEEAWLRNTANSAALCDHLRSRGADYDRVVTGPYLFGVVYAAALVHPSKTFLVPCLHDEPYAHLAIMRRLFEGVAGILFNTEPERDLARALFKIPESRGRVVGMGIPEFDADPAAFARRSGIAQPYVIYSGRREDGKGTPMLCDYLAAFRARTERDVKLVFTGSGDIAAPPELQAHIVDLGFVSEQEKHEAMAGAVAFMHPSLFESLGIVLLESWMARTPALVHANSRVLQWQCAQSNAGLWFRSYPEFEQELLMLLEKPGLRDALGRNGREYVLREYSWASVEKRFFAALESI